MSCVWQLHEAKSKFSEVVEAALKYGPQVITKRGADTAVVLSYMEYRQLTLSNGKVSDFFRESPLSGADLDLTRDGSRLREDPSL
jgi:prevent-host-death family protein